MEILRSARKKVGLSHIHFSEIPSTNSWLLSHAEYLIQDGLFVTADRQTAGRGRFNRHWEGGRGDHLFCSLVVHPALPQHLLPSLSIIIGLGVFQALSELGVANLSLKWPNDVLAEGRKISGILCEVPGRTSPPAVVVGIGVNITGDRSQFSRGLHPLVTTVAENTGREIAVAVVGEEILNRLDDMLYTLDEKKCTGYFSQWESVSSSLGRRITFQDKGREQSGTILGLGPSGALKIALPSGATKEIAAGEIRFHSSPAAS